MTTDGGSISVEQRYYPYGETRWSSGTLPKDYQYTGQRNETTLGIYDYRARFYSPKSGRFLSADTLVPGVGGQHLNRYMYVTGNPVRYNDPSGHARPTEESENYNYTGQGPYPGQPGWYEAGRAYQEALKAWCDYKEKPSQERARRYRANKESFEQYRNRARNAMPQVLWTGDNIASLYETVGTVGLGVAASLSGGPNSTGPSGIPSSLQRDILGDPDCAEFGTALRDGGTIIYRGGGKNPANLVPRIEDNGELSFRDSISNPLGEKPVLRPGREFIAVDISKLPPGSVIWDNVPDGHVSVKNVPLETMQDALIGKWTFPR